MVRSHVRIALYVSLALILCLPAGAWQQSIGGAAGSAGNISLPTYDGVGRVVAVTDSTGNTVRPGGGAATLAAAAAHAANVTAQPAAAPVTIHVPADQPTIQAATMRRRMAIRCWFQMERTKRTLISRVKRSP